MVRADNIGDVVTARRGTGARDRDALRRAVTSTGEDGTPLFTPDQRYLIVRGRFTPDDGAALIAAIEAMVPPPIWATIERARYSSGGSARLVAFPMRPTLVRLGDPGT